MLRSFTSIVLGIVLLSWAGGVRLVANTFYAATVTFSDRVDDKITSDYQSTGNHAYVNGGTAKLECGFWQQSGDFVLRRVNGPAPKNPRYLAFSLTPITPSTAPSGSITQSDVFMNIRDILTLPRGSAKNAIALFTTAFGELMLTSNPMWIDTSIYPSLVDVYRTGNTWIITADPNTPPPGPGDVAAITKVKSNKEQLVGLYHTPFQVTVTCPTCP